ncbi:putative multidrug resistance protein MdtD [Halalkalicoccus paucihalophilus]|uniref:Putative multidrug resistance protein MdtD n=1 Tax=Halalkalicoccus paucihalophilus TaxID=1008153 RepID=A0A151A9A3_9EURY|nr:MFS transporter [Halalkalicoccus paucihalophilus]KYH24215.1 putative multidrug resistance protein MdtD [Halalkalicoccus paucihalophilus]
MDLKTGLQYWAPAIAVSLTTFMVTINASLMNVAIPTMVDEFDTTVTVIQGAVSLYSLAIAALVLPAGTLPSRHSIRRVLAVALTVYAGGTVVASISWNTTILYIGWSLIQGSAAAVIFPLTFTVLRISYEDDERAKAFGLLAGVGGIGSTLGPIIGGALTTYASWRWGFAIQLIGVGFILFFIQYVSPNPLSETCSSLDKGGTALSIVGATSLVTGFLLSGKYGWLIEQRPFFIGEMQFNPFGTSPAIWFLWVGLLTFAAFVQYERRMEHAGKSPLVPLHVLTNRPFLAGVLTYNIRSIVSAGFFFIFPIYLQAVLGYTAFETGLALLPYSLASILFASFTPNWRKYISPKTLIQIGIVCMGLGLVLLYEQTGPGQTISKMVIPVTLYGVGVGLILGQITNMTMSAVPTAHSAEASGVLNVSYSIGFSLGTAVVGSYFLGHFYGGVVDRVLRAEHVTVSVERRNDLVIALEDAVETATEATQQDFLNQLTPIQHQLLESIFEAAMFDAQRAALLLLVLFVLLLLIASTFLPRQIPEEDE